MKKTLKFAWMLLLALPTLAFTACGDDDEPIVELPDDEVALFEDYSVLLGKNRQGVINYFGEEPYEMGADYQLFVVGENNVDDVRTWYSYFEGEIFDEVVIVESYLSDELNTIEVSNFLNTLYEFEGIDDDGWFTYKHGDYRINYIPEAAVEEDEIGNFVQYIDLKKLDSTKGNDFDLKAATKAHIRKK